MELASRRLRSATGLLVAFPGADPPILASVLFRPNAVHGRIRRSHGWLRPITRRSVIAELSRPSIGSGDCRPRLQPSPPSNARRT